MLDELIESEIPYIPSYSSEEKSRVFAQNLINMILDHHNPQPDNTRRIALLATWGE